MGKQLQKMKMQMPLFKGVEVKPNLLQLVLAKAALVAHHGGETVRVVKGTRVQPVSLKHMEARVRALESSNVDDDEGVQERLRLVEKKFVGKQAARRRDRVYMASEGRPAAVVTEVADGPGE